MAGAITINSNISALTAQRRLGQSTQSLRESFARLSSGLRINNAGDDAAGLAIASGLQVDRRVFSQGVRNLNDGLSALNIADAAVESLTNIVIRFEELAEQSANGTLGHKQRASLDDEAQALSQEYFRISRSAEFNGKQLLDGSIGDVRIQAGYGESGGIVAGFGGVMGTGSFSEAKSYLCEPEFSNPVALGDLNGDGVLDLVTAGRSDESSEGWATVRLGLGDGSFGAARSYATEEHSSFAAALGDLDGDGILDLVTAGYSDTVDGYATVRLGQGDGTFGQATSYAMEGRYSWAVALADLNGDGGLDLVTAGTTDASDGYATLRLGLGDGTFRQATSYANELGSSNSVALGDLNSDGVLDLVTAGGTDISDGYATIRLSLTQDGVSPLLPFDLSTMAGARQALPVFKQKLDQLTSQRGEIGAFQARIGVAILRLHENWNQGSAETPHLGSIMLAPEILPFVGVFALLEHGCREVWITKGDGVIGMEPADYPEQAERFLRFYADKLSRRFAYAGTAGDCNVHVMTGRSH